MFAFARRLLLGGGGSPSCYLGFYFQKHSVRRMKRAGVGVTQQLDSKQEVRHPGGMKREMFFPRLNRGVSNWKRWQ